MQENALSLSVMTERLWHVQDFYEVLITCSGLFFTLSASYYIIGLPHFKKGLIYDVIGSYYVIGVYNSSVSPGNILLHESGLPQHADRRRLPHLRGDCADVVQVSLWAVSRLVKLHGFSHFVTTLLTYLAWGAGWRPQSVTFQAGTGAQAENCGKVFADGEVCHQESSSLPCGETHPASRSATGQFSDLRRGAAERDRGKCSCPNSTFKECFSAFHRCYTGSKREQTKFILVVIGHCEHYICIMYI